MPPNHEQAEHWNNVDNIGHWITEQARHDRVLAPFAEMIFEVARLAPDDRVLDVGCGCGTTTLAAARQVARGRVTGLDISRPMLERARAEAAGQGLTNVDFLEADAQVHRFHADAYDAVISRFGIMFFDDPVAAFANLRAATKPGGRLTFVCWQPLSDNQWLTVPGAAVLRHVPPPEPVETGAPGMFAFADPERLRAMLGEARWNDVSTTARHTAILVGGGGGVDGAVELLQYGPLGRGLLANADARTVARAVADMRAALAEHLTDDGVMLDAAVWLAQAVA